MIIERRVFEEYVRKARGLGLRVIVWNTRDYEYDYSLYREISGLIDEVIVDDPVRVKSVLEAINT